ncbi:hypothetical protein RHMOL_Rhmol04G0191600 [Rhododendron molle]|uniref:Uncharacterized protein n=1 Tax=Rhododendron molle TaxID=49168 RepID=A0ACC0P236_RHOML|nr:hypothetical protein RHMOL_Rhmol04G0191600 [Rhododendron molle]
MAAGSISEPVGTNTEARASPVVGGSSGDAENSGTIGDETGPNGSPPRDSAKGKGVVIEEEHVEEVQIEIEQTTEAAPFEIREEDIAFRPPAGAATSSRHVPITYDDIAEHAPDEILARVLEQHPEIGEYVLKAKEDRARAIEEAEAAARAERDRVEPEGLAADVEAEEREAEEAQRPRVSAVAEAGALKRPEFSEGTYMPPRPHLFVPLGFAGYRPPQQADYDPELILRDPGVHIATTWAEGSTVHLSYLPALRDLRAASRFDWGGAALGTAYQFFGDASRNGQSMAGYWRVWELWAYEVLRMYPPECKHPDLSILPRALKWSKEHKGTKEGRGSLNAYRLYLDELRASQVPGPLPPRASHTGDYTLAELERFTRPDTELTRHLRPTMDYAVYQRDRLARPFGIRARREIQEQAREAGAERRATAEAPRGGERRVRRRESRPVVGGPPELLWKVDVVDHQGNTAEVELVPALREPAAVTVQVPAEWVNEALRRMLALENLVKKAAQGMPL